MDFQERRRLRLVELGHLRSQITALQPWQTLDLPLDFAGTEQCCVVLGTVPASVRLPELQSALAKVSGAAVLFPVSAGKEGQCLELICFHELREACIAGLEPYGFSVVCFPEGTGIAAEAIQAAETLQTRLQAEVEALTAALAAMGECRADLQLGLDQLTLQIAAEEEKGRLSGTEQTVYLQGLAAAQNAEMLEGIFARYSCAWEWTEAEPTARKRFRPYTFVTRYTEPDRNK